MSLPPLANVFAFSDVDPQVRNSVERSLRERGKFNRIRNSGRWVLGEKFLPGRTDHERVDLIFAEGGDLFPDDGPLRRRTTTSPELLSRFDGDFTFIFVTANACYAVRSCGGLVPLYVFQDQSRIALASRLTDLARHVPKQFELDPLPHALWMTGQAHFPDQRTFLQNVRCVPRGHVQIVSASASIAVSYWQPRVPSIPWPKSGTRTEHQEEFRRILLAQLERDLDPRGPNLLTLSGGVDSSSIAALASRVLDREVNSLSFIPPAGEERARELHFLENLASQLPLGSRRVLPLDTRRRIEYVRERPSVVFPVGHPALCVLPRIIGAAPAHVLVGGEFGDETTGAVATFPDWVQMTSVLRLVMSLRSLPRGWKDIVRWARLRFETARDDPPVPFREQLSDIFNASVRDEYVDWYRETLAAAARDDLAWRNLHLRTHNDQFLAMNWEATTELEIRRSFPYFNRRILEFTFRLHPSELVGPGLRKLPRAALLGDVPYENLFRDDRGHYRSKHVGNLPTPPTDARTGQVIAPSSIPSEEAYPGLWSLSRFLQDLDVVQEARG